MLVSIECSDVVGVLDKIKVAASLGDLGDAVEWNDDGLMISDENGKELFVPHIMPSPPHVDCGLANSCVRFESFMPVVMPNRAAELENRRALAEKLKILFSDLILRHGHRRTEFKISIAEI